MATATSWHLDNGDVISRSGWHEEAGYVGGWGHEDAGDVGVGGRGQHQLDVGVLIMMMGLRGSSWKLSMLCNVNIPEENGFKSCNSNPLSQQTD